MQGLTSGNIVGLCFVPVGVSLKWVAHGWRGRTVLFEECWLSFQKAFPWSGGWTFPGTMKITLESPWEPLQQQQQVCLKEQSEQFPPLWYLKLWPLGISRGWNAFPVLDDHCGFLVWGYSLTWATTPGGCFPEAQRWTETDEEVPIMALVYKVFNSGPIPQKAWFRMLAFSWVNKHEDMKCQKRGVKRKKFSLT